MKIGVAQLRPFKGAIEKNIEIHKRLIALVCQKQANAIFFPELSLTAYEPSLAKTLAIDSNDELLNDFQTLSDQYAIIIGLGMPTLSDRGILISMLIFQPTLPRQVYSKQYLHEDECPYFTNGLEQIFLSSNNLKIAPAICYESLLPVHAAHAFKNEADIYLASVAKSQKGINKGKTHYAMLAKKYSKIVLMSNCIGYCDNFESVGQSAIWDKNGQLIAQLNHKEIGVLIYDTIHQTAEKVLLKENY